MEKIRTEPSKKLYFLPVGLAVIGVVGILVINTLMSAIYQKVIISGKEDIKLKAGKYTVYNEIRTTVDGIVSKTKNADLYGLKFSVLDRKTNTQVINPNYSLLDSSNSSAIASVIITTDDLYWKSIAEFEVINPSTYEISGWYEVQKNRPQVAILIVREGTENELVYVLGIKGILLVTFAGAIIFIVTFIKRQKYQKIQ